MKNFLLSSVFLVIYTVLFAWVFWRVKNKFDALWILGIFSLPASFVGNYVSDIVCPLLKMASNFVMDGLFVYLLGALQYGLIGYLIGYLCSVADES